MKSGVVPGGSASVAVLPAVPPVVLPPATALTTSAAVAAAASVAATTRVEVLRLMRQPSFLGTGCASPKIVERVTSPTLTGDLRPAQTRCCDRAPIRRR